MSKSILVKNILYLCNCVISNLIPLYLLKRYYNKKRHKIDLCINFTLLASFMFNINISFLQLHIIQIHAENN